MRSESSNAPFRLDPEQIELIDDETIAALRHLTDAQNLPRDPISSTPHETS
jgi:hypothetical protein